MQGVQRGPLFPLQTIGQVGRNINPKDEHRPQWYKLLWTLLLEMIVILDTAKGQAYNFKFRKEAAEFIGVSLPTLRGWLAEPFYLYKTLIITHTTNEKILKSNRELLKRHIEKIGEDERTNGKAVDLPGVVDQNQNIPIDNPRPEEPAHMDRPNW